MKTGPERIGAHHFRRLARAAARFPPAVFEQRRRLLEIRTDRRTRGKSEHTGEQCDGRIIREYADCHQTDWPGLARPPTPDGAECATLSGHQSKAHLPQASSRPVL